MVTSSVGAARSERTVVWCALAVLCAVATLANADAEKRAELAPAPFVMGSRYGRSPPRLLAPRNDRFFMGSRYGKRSDPEQSSQMAPLSTLIGQGPRAPPTLLCEYTGISSLYHCRRNGLDIRRMDDDPLASEED